MTAWAHVCFSHSGLERINHSPAVAALDAAEALLGVCPLVSRLRACWPPR